jgi:integrase/recombinase XerD
MYASSAHLVPAPVEYAAAVERYLGQASLGPASRRVYRISLAAWAWPLVGQRAPRGERRRGAVPPVVPLARLDDPSAAARLAAALADRASAGTDARTVNRELSALRSAVGWWLDQRWISTDPTAGLRRLATSGTALPPLTPAQADSLFRATTSLREHAFWRMLYDTAAPAGEVLGLDIGHLDLARHRAHTNADQLAWREGTTQLLRWLLAGRTEGPVFLTGRHAPAASDPAHTCPVTGRARMSYRRAVEIFTAATRPLDPSGRGWTLHQLSLAAEDTGRQPKKTSASA